ncbi:hypothetical protein M885DRAFT_588399 [Pelagophyceae sp. CCMP2097]|nr:hypothetical protein M885DRAFT_588399 [Pelagophyceae sp. CCMP2097]
MRRRSCGAIPACDASGAAAAAEAPFSLAASPRLSALWPRGHARVFAAPRASRSAPPTPQTAKRAADAAVALLATALERRNQGCIAVDGSRALLAFAGAAAADPAAICNLLATCAGMSQIVYVEHVRIHWKAADDETVSRISKQFPRLKRFCVAGCGDFDEWTKMSDHGLAALVENCPNLQAIKLLHCGNVQTLPAALGLCADLAAIDLTHCFSLIQIPKQLRNCAKLHTISFWGCSALKRLPVWLGELKELRSLDLSCCTSLAEAPAFAPLGDCFALTSLNLSHCKGVDSNALARMHRCNRLRELNLTHCAGVCELPDWLRDCNGLETLSLKLCTGLDASALRRGLCGCDALTDLDASYCALSSEMLQKLPKTLQKLDVSRAKGSAQLPERLGALQSLTYLCAMGVAHIDSLPSSLGKCAALTRIDLSRCRGLGCVALQRLGDIKALQWLDVSQNPFLATLPAALGNCAELRRLDASQCDALVDLPEELGNIATLAYVDVRGCGGLTSAPAGAKNGLLRQLEARGCHVYR